MRSYAEIRGRPEDFVVRYRLYTPEEGGRQVTYQHLRCDFLYDGDDPDSDGIWMIHPEFLDRDGRPLGESEPVELEGYASMWIVNPEMRPVHRTRVEPGVKGYFVEGARKIGDVEVVKVTGLRTGGSQAAP